MAKQGFKAEVQITGLQKVAKDISWLKDKGLKQELRGLNRKAGELVKRASNPPRRTGRLAASMAVRPGLRYTSVKAGGARTPYAPPIHWGWKARGIRANKFITRAAAQSTRALHALYERGIAHLTKQVSARRGR